MLFACVHRPDPGLAPGLSASSEGSPLLSLAHDFSPRYECQRADLVSIDVSGLSRLFGSAREIGDALRRAAAARGLQVHVALAGTWTAAMLLALGRPGLTIAAPGDHGSALASLPIGMLEQAVEHTQAAAPAALPARDGTAARARHQRAGVDVKSVFRAWGLRTLGELAALSPTDLAARLGRSGLAWQALARGEDARPLVPTLPDERFESSMDLEWPVEGLEPVSFVLTRLLEPLVTRLERRDRGAAVLHVGLRLVPCPDLARDGAVSDGGERLHLREVHARSLQLPAPIRDVRTLRTLALLDLESHPPAAAVDRITVVIEPTPGRVWQHTLFARAQPAPEQLSTLLARLGALMGQDRIGAPAAVDSHRPGAFEMVPFAMPSLSTARGAPPALASLAHPRSREPQAPSSVGSRPRGEPDSPSLISALRRCRHPVPARVAVNAGRPVRVTADRRGFSGGNVMAAAGPWRTSGEWWGTVASRQSSDSRGSSVAREAAQARLKGDIGAWERDEWDVALSDGAVYRMFRDRITDAWFIEAIVD